MARARNLKPGLFKNEILGAADPLYTLLFEGLWILADREGRLEDRPLRIKGEVFPYRDGVNVDAMLTWLQAHGFILRYEAQGKKCILVLEFVKHQNPHRNESESVLPSHEEVQPSTEALQPTSELLQKNREEIESASDFSGTTRADSLSSDSLHSDSLIPSTLIPERETASRKRAAPFPLPEWINRDHWDAWHSCSKRRNATDKQKQLAVDKLTAWKEEGIDYAAALENAAIGGWQGLFKPDEQKHGGSAVNKQEALEQRNRGVASSWAAGIGNYV